MATRTTVSNIPDWLAAGVTDYQQKHSLQSWSQAAVILMAVGLHRQTVDDPARDGYIAGSKEAEAELWQRFTDSGMEDFEEWLIAEIGHSWGGKRK